MINLFKRKDIEDKKIEKIIKSLLIELDKIDQWRIYEKYKNRLCRVKHKYYDLNVDYLGINRPYSISIPRKWRKIVKHKIFIIEQSFRLQKLDFILDVLEHEYPIQIIEPTDYQIAWCKENKIEYEHRISVPSYLYIKKGEGAIAFKMKWL